MQLQWRHHQHLLLIDLYSGGMSFYLARGVRGLPSIDFTSLVLLGQVWDDRICQFGHIVDNQALQSLIRSQLASFNIHNYQLVFLIAPTMTELEKTALTGVVPFWQTVQWVNRDYFYNFYLTQKRNFSPVKLLVHAFIDSVEVSLFHQEKLLAQECYRWSSASAQVSAFFHTKLALHVVARPDCFYYFTNAVPTFFTGTDFAKALQLEPIAIPALP